jgi:hypothetical protein
MDNSKLNSWLSLIANVAVVGGIIFLAIEIQQNNVLLRSESRQALLTNDHTSLVTDLAHLDVIQKLASGAELSTEEQLRLSFVFLIDLRNREFEYAQFVNGLLDEPTWLSYRNVILINHASGRGRVWWDKIGRNIVDPEFSKMVDELLVDAEESNIYRDLGTWDED